MLFEFFLWTMDVLKGHKAAIISTQKNLVQLRENRVDELRI